MSTCKDRPSEISLALLARDSYHGANCAALWLGVAGNMLPAIRVLMKLRRVVFMIFLLVESDAEG